MELYSSFCGKEVIDSVYTDCRNTAANDYPQDTDAGTDYLMADWAYGVSLMDLSEYCIGKALDLDSLEGRWSKVAVRRSQKAGVLMEMGKDKPRQGKASDNSKVKHTKRNHIRNSFHRIVNRCHARCKANKKRDADCGILRQGNDQQGDSRPAWNLTENC